MKNYLLIGWLALFGSVSGVLAAVLPLPEPIPAPHSRESKLNQNNDHGLWLNQDINFAFSNECNGRFRFEQRLGSNYRLWWYYGYELTLQCNLTKQLQTLLGPEDKNVIQLFSIGPGFKEFTQILRNTKGQFNWVWANRPMLEANMNLKIKKWALEQRARVEHISYNSSHYREHFTYRYRIELLFPWKLTRFDISPFISNEFFFRKNSWSKQHTTRLIGGFFEDRFRIGLTSKAISKSVITEVWWQWRPLKRSVDESYLRWVNTYQYGISLIFSL